MSLFSDILAADAAAFANEDEFGEAAVYHGTDTTGRQISIGIQRGNAPFPRQIAEAPQSLGYAFMISVRNDATKGISRQELVTGQDTIEFAEKSGDPTKKTFRITGVESEDPGMLLLRVK